jgi:sec-independent protein translocase protein TatC
VSASPKVGTEAEAEAAAASATNAAPVLGAGGRPMTFIEHATELRRRLVVSIIAVIGGTAAGYLLYEPVLLFMLRPLDQLASLTQSEASDARLFINTVFEGFLVRLKVAFISGIAVSLPVHLYNVIRFVFPGLSRREKRTVAAALLASSILLAAGFFYSYYNVIPLSVKFLTGAGFMPPGVGLLLGFDRNVFFIFQFLLVFLLVFQIPIVLVLLMMTGALKRRALLRSSRYAVVAIFALSAAVTPPDVVSQVSLAVPMVGMFFLSILVARIFGFGGD